MLGKLHTLQKEPPILCEETEFIFRGNDFSRRPRYAIELRVLRGARTRVPVPRTRVSYWEQVNNWTLRNWRDDHLSWSYQPSGTLIPVLVIHSHRNEIDSSSFSVRWLHYTRGGKTRISSTLSFHFLDHKITMSHVNKLKKVMLDWDAICKLKLSTFCRYQLTSSSLQTNERK